MKAHLQILTDLEKRSEFSLMWGRKNDNTIWVSTVGYQVQEQNNVEKTLLKAGCRYDFNHRLQEFDRANGRTITFLKEPKEKEVDWNTATVAGVYSNDYPKFCDAYFDEGFYTDGTALTDDELDKLSNEEGELLNEMAHDQLY